MPARQARIAGRLQLLTSNEVAEQYSSSLSLLLKLFVYFRRDTLKGGWGTSQTLLMIIKSAKNNTQSITLAAKIARYLSSQPSHYSNLSIDGSEKMYCKEDYVIFGSDRSPMSHSVCP